MSCPAAWASGPSCPQPVMRPYTSRGLRSPHTSGPRPKRSITPGRLPSITPSLCATNSSACALSSARLRFNVTRRLPRDKSAPSFGVSSSGSEPAPGRPTTVTPYRGAGRQHGVFVMERLLDIAANELNIDRAEIRRINLIPADAFPYNNEIMYQDFAPLSYDSGNYEPVLDMALEAIGYAGFKAEQAAARAEGRHIGLGLACYVEGTGIGPYEGAKVQVQVLDLLKELQREYRLTYLFVAHNLDQTIIDPEGDFVTLAERFGHLVIDAEDHTERGLQVAGERARIHRVSTVLNLEGLDAENQMRRAAAFLNGLFEVGRDHWYPMLVVVDEAQLFAPAVAGEVSDEARKLSLGAMTNLMCRGRKRGLAGIIATQRLAKLAKNVAAEASNFLMGRTFLDIDMARAADLLGMERRQADAFRDLERGQFMALGPALSRRPLGLRIGPTETQPRNATPRLMPMPEATMDAHAMILAAPPPEPTRRRGQGLWFFHPPPTIVQPSRCPRPRPHRG
eukprot:gene31006-41283_t